MLKKKLFFIEKKNKLFVQIFFLLFRYIVAIHPVSCACHWFQSHSRHMLLASWICGAAYASIPVSNTYTTVFEVDGTEYRQCNYDNELSELKRSLFAVTNFVLTFTLPLAIMSFSYLAIMRRLKNSEKFITVYTAGQAIAGNGSRTKSSSEVVFSKHIIYTELIFAYEPRSKKCLQVMMAAVE